MSESLDHLSPAAKEVIALPVDERIRKIQSRRFTDYPRCHMILDLMAQQLTQPKGRMKPNLLVSGESGQGKTTIIEKHGRDYPALFDQEAGIKRTTLVSINMPAFCDVPWFFMLLIETVNGPAAASYRSIGQLAMRTIKLYRDVGIRQLVFDEAHNLLQGNPSEQRKMLSVIRTLVNELGVPMAFFGDAGAREAFISDKQLLRRFQIVDLPTWQPGDDFNALVGSVVRSIPLKRPSVITPRALKALVSTAGTTGGTFEILLNLGETAIRSGEERITADAILDYVKLVPAQ